MNLLCDEGVDAQVVRALRDAGHTVLFIAEMEPGVDDDTVLHRANAAGALLVTADKDFGEMVYRLARLHTGVVLLRLAGLTPDTRATLVTAVVCAHADELHGAFSVVSPGAVRIRRQG